MTFESSFQNTDRRNITRIRTHTYRQMDSHRFTIGMMSNYRHRFKILTQLASDQLAYTFFLECMAGKPSRAVDSAARDSMDDDRDYVGKRIDND